MTRPVVYVAGFGRPWPSDIAGGLITEEGKILAEHVSSSLSWLRVDLLAKRRDELEHRYPEGFDVVEVEHWRQLPEHLVKILDGEGEGA